MCIVAAVNTRHSASTEIQIHKCIPVLFARSLHFVVRISGKCDALMSALGLLQPAECVKIHAP